MVRLFPSSLPEWIIFSIPFIPIALSQLFIDSQELASNLGQLHGIEYWAAVLIPTHLEEVYLETRLRSWSGVANTITTLAFVITYAILLIARAIDLLIPILTKRELGTWSFCVPALQEFLHHSWNLEQAQD
jgi:hypothetical protein